MGHIDHEGHVRAVGTRPEVRLVAVVLLKALKQRDVGGLKLPPGKIDLPGGGLGRHDLGAVNSLDFEVIDIGQLVAGRIYFGVVGVAAVADARRSLADHHVSGLHWLVKDH